MKNNNLSQQIEDLIASVVLPLEEARVEIIEPNYVAAEVDSKLGECTELRRYISLLEIKQRTRKFLIQRHGIKDNSIDDSQIEIFSSELQERYPVNPKDKKSGYKLLSTMNQEELQRNIDILRKSGRARLRHADNLEAYAVEREDQE